VFRLEGVPLLASLHIERALRLEPDNMAAQEEKALVDDAWQASHTSSSSSSSGNVTATSTDITATASNKVSIAYNTSCLCLKRLLYALAVPAHSCNAVYTAKTCLTNLDSQLSRCSVQTKIYMSWLMYVHTVLLYRLLQMDLLQGNRLSKHYW
jgi:hypothetical protein